MHIKEFFKDFKHTYFAESKFESRVHEFFESIPMDNGGMSLRYKRKSGFLDDPISKNNFPLIALKSDNSIAAFGTLKKIDCKFNSRNISYGYFSDLRMSPRLDQGIRKEWGRAHYNSISTIHKYDQTKDIKFFLTSILDGNRVARLYLKKMMKGMEYEDVMKYQTINILARIPGWKLLINSMQLLKSFSLSEEEYSEEIKNFIERYESDFSLKTQVFKKRYLIVRDATNRIIGACAPVKDNEKSYVVEKVEDKMTKALGLVNFLTGKKIAKNSEIKCLYLNSFYIDKTLSNLSTFICKHVLLNFAYDSKFISDPTVNLMTYLLNHQENSINDKMGWFSYGIKATIYQVLSPGEKYDSHREYLNGLKSQPKISLDLMSL